MRILVLDDSDASVGLCHRLGLDGHTVFRCCVHPKYALCGKGFVSNVETPNVFADAEAKSAQAQIERILPRTYPELIVVGGANAEEYTKMFMATGQPTVTLGQLNAITSEGQELSVGWSNGKDKINLRPLHVYSRLLAGDAGPDVGYVGCMIGPRAVELEVTSTLVGPILVVGGEVTSLPLQFLPTLTELLPNKSHALIDALMWCAGEVEYEPVMHLSTAVGMLCTVPSFPYADPQPRELVGLNPKNTSHVWLYDTELENGQVWVGRRSCRAFEVTAWGEETDAGPGSKEARRRIFRSLSELKVEGLQYRNDVGVW